MASQMGGRAADARTSSGVSYSTIPQPLERPAVGANGQVSRRWVGYAASRRSWRPPRVRGRAASALTALVADDVRVDDRADLPELILQVLPRRTPCQVADVHPPADAHNILLCAHASGSRWARALDRAQRPRVLPACRPSPACCSWSDMALAPNSPSPPNVRPPTTAHTQDCSSAAGSWWRL